LLAAMIAVNSRSTSRNVDCVGDDDDVDCDDDDDDDAEVSNNGMRTNDAAGVVGVDDDDDDDDDEEDDDDDDNDGTARIREMSIYGRVAAAVGAPPSTPAAASLLPRCSLLWCSSSSASKLSTERPTTDHDDGR
jgi:hypothetical protein